MRGRRDAHWGWGSCSVVGGVVNDFDNAPKRPAAATAALIRVVGEAFAGDAVVNEDGASGRGSL